MNITVRSLTLALTLAAALLLGTAATVYAQTTITYLPYTITTKGTYVLGTDINSTQTSGNLITINASNVTIDFQGHYIAGAVATRAKARSASMPTSRAISRSRTARLPIATNASPSTATALPRPTALITRLTTCG